MNDAIQNKAEDVLAKIEDRVLYLREQKRLATEVILHGEIPEDSSTSIKRENRLTSRTFVFFHSEWVSLIPESPEIRAVLAYLIADKYDLVENRSQIIWDALRLDDTAVQDFYQKCYHQSIETWRVLEESSPNLFTTTFIGVIELNTVYNNLQRLTMRQGDILFNQGDSPDNIYVLAKGHMKVFLQQERGNRLVGDLKDYSLIGEIALLTGEPRTATIQAETDCELWYLAVDVFKDLMEDSPESFTQVFETASQRYYYSYFMKHIQSLFGELDAKLLDSLFRHSELIHLDRGEFLFQKNELCKGWYLIANGRLQLPDLSDATVTGQFVFEQGSSIGTEELLFDHKHSFSVVALCDTEVISLSAEGFDILWNSPNLIRTMFKNTFREHQITMSANKQVSGNVIALGMLTSNSHLSQTIPRIIDLFHKRGSVLFLDPTILNRILNLPDSALTEPNHVAWMRIRSWYSQMILQYDYLVFAFHPEYPLWNQFCQSSAETLIGIVDADQSPNHSNQYKWFEAVEQIVVQKRWLILVHAENKKIPRGTSNWLQQYNQPDHLHLAGVGESELMRLVRTVIGKSIGIVLGGGSAKGLAHLGVFNAFRDAGIPIDWVGGTSMGGLLGALYAMRLSFDEVKKLQQLLLDLNPFRDFALPQIALLKERKFKQFAQIAFDEICIEDFWLKYYCVSTNLSTAQEMVHDSGFMRNASYATGALPVVIPPYIDGTDVLVDGGLLNNVPIDHMLQRTLGPIIGVNASPLRKLEYHVNSLEDSPNSMIQKLRSQFQSESNLSLFDILSEAMVVSSHRKVLETKDRIDLFLELPLSQFKMTQFDAMEEMMSLSHEYSLPLLTELKKNQIELQYI
jgi:predicted acylesterase/phospholipase RssA/CRP-like cAMP-binding protein